jgi:CheY-like chemotaxis protein
VGPLRRSVIAVLWLLATSRPGFAEAAPPGQTKFRWFGGSEGLRNLAISSIAQDLLPAAPSRSSEPFEPGGIPAAPPGRLRILLVDDEPLVAHTMERLLRRDYDTIIEESGHDALVRIARGERFAAIVSDIMMPNMTGIELFEQLQHVAPDQAARLIFLSGGAFTPQARERLDGLGVIQLDKPVAAKQLRACILRIASAQP